MVNKAKVFGLWALMAGMAAGCGAGVTSGECSTGLTAPGPVAPTTTADQVSWAPATVRSWMDTPLPWYVYATEDVSDAAWAEATDRVCRVTLGAWCPVRALERTQSNISVSMGPLAEGELGHAWGRPRAKAGVIVVAEGVTDDLCIGTILAHELMHLAGLDHSDDPESLMAAYLPACGSDFKCDDTQAFMDYQYGQ